MLPCVHRGVRIRTADTQAVGAPERMRVLTIRTRHGDPHRGGGGGGISPLYKKHASPRYDGERIVTTVGVQSADATLTGRTRAVEQHPNTPVNRTLILTIIIIIVTN